MVFEQLRYVSYIVVIVYVIEDVEVPRWPEINVSGPAVALCAISKPIVLFISINWVVWVHWDIFRIRVVTVSEESPIFFRCVKDVKKCLPIKQLSKHGPIAILEVDFVIESNKHGLNLPAKVEAKFVIVPVNEFSKHVNCKFTQFNGELIMNSRIQMNLLGHQEVRSRIWLEAYLPIFNIITRTVWLFSLPTGFDHRRCHLKIVVVFILLEVNHRVCNPGHQDFSLITLL